MPVGSGSGTSVLVGTCVRTTLGVGVAIIGWEESGVLEEMLQPVTRSSKRAVVPNLQVDVWHIIVPATACRKRT